MIICTNVRAGALIAPNSIARVCSLVGRSDNAAAPLASTIEDSSNAPVISKTLALLIEDDKETAARMGATATERPGIPMDSLEQFLCSKL